MKRFILLLLIMTTLIWSSTTKSEASQTYKQKIEKILSHKYDRIVWDGAKESYDKGRKYFKEEDYENALKYFISAAKDGYEYSLDYLVYMVYHGKGIKANTKLAFKLYLRRYRVGLKIQDFPLVWLSNKEEKPLSFKKNKLMLLDEAKQKNPDAFIQLGNAYRIGEFGFEKDKHRALKWYMWAMKENDLAGLIQSGYLCNEGIGEKKECEIVYNNMREKANKGNSFALYILGEYYYKKKKFERAKEYLLKASKNNSYSARDLLAKMDIEGSIHWQGAKRYIFNRPEFEKMLFKEWKNGNIGVAFYLGEYYDSNSFIDGAREKAIKYYRAAAENGDSRAYYPLASIYRYSRTKSEEDIKNAIRWFLKAKRYDSDEEYKYKHIVNNLLYCYEELIDVYSKNGDIEKKETYERKLYSLASEGARKQVVDAQIKLAELYEYGQATYKNSNKAFSLYKKVAENNESQYLSSFAKMKVGKMYFYGSGVQKNYILSYAWLNKSLADLDEKNKKYVNTLMSRLERLLTQSQIIYAQNLDITTNNKPNKKRNNPSAGTTGTGFFVTNTYILTNNHVVKNCKRIEIHNKQYKSGATLMEHDSVNDLAILQVTKKNNSFLMFKAGRGARVGEEVVVLGYPLGALLGSGIKLTSGNISALTGLVNDTTKVQLTAPVQPGNSGGPLLDRSGNVVGVIVARLEKGLSGRTAQNVNLAIKSNVAQMFLDTNNIDYEVKMSKQKKELPDIAEEAKSAVVQVMCYE